MPPFIQPKLSIPSSLSFRDKTILITGASAGIGLAATKLLLLHGAKEIIAGVRSVSKQETAKSNLLSDPEVKRANPHGVITILQLNLEDYDSVLQFSKVIKQRYYGNLDMLLLNAGTGSLKWDIIANSGHEKTIQVNLLSQALLSFELLPTLEKTAATKGVPSRMTWVGSFVQFDHTLDKKPIEADDKVLAHYDNEKNFIAPSRYADSKLLVTMFVEELAKYVDPKKVIVNELSPGMVKTGFGDFPAWFRAIFNVLFFFTARNAEEGSKTYLHAMGVVGEESHGKYLSDNKVAKRAPITSTPKGKEIRKKLWNEIWTDCLKVDSSLETPKRHAT
ncbi:short-chain dehydrogenase/reductase family protein [Xylogone sp. PMI_703]|nr:short-chain dehydrogenase/reductase family protein [Xylogone sp. PMI_703]